MKLSRQKSLGDCPKCHRCDWWLNDVPLTGFCWGTKNKPHPEVRRVVPQKYNPYKIGGGKMVKCNECGLEMGLDTTKSCDELYIYIGSKKYKRNTTYFDVNKRCHDCNIVNKKGNTHHFGCDIERCPKCKGQLISCDCEKEL